MENTLFLSVFICHPDYNIQILDSILTYVFEWLPMLTHIGYLVNSSYTVGSPISDFKLPKDVDKSDNKKTKALKTKYFNQILSKGTRPSLWLSSRKDFTKTFKIRKSRVEDCDDISPMLLKQNSVLF